jgi:hypothetical protein
MTKLIARVRVATLVDGKPQEFLPGSELPELSPQDTQELLRMGSVEEAAEAASTEKTTASTEGGTKKK